MNTFTSNRRLSSWMDCSPMVLCVIFKRSKNCPLLVKCVWRLATYYYIHVMNAVLQCVERCYCWLTWPSSCSYRSLKHFAHTQFTIAASCIGARANGSEIIPIMLSATYCGHTLEGSLCVTACCAPLWQMYQVHVKPQKDFEMWAARWHIHGREQCSWSWIGSIRKLECERRWQLDINAGQFH